MKALIETYQEDLVKYFTSKVTESNIDMPASVLLEMAQYAMIQTQIVVNNEVMRTRNELLRQWDRYCMKSANKSDTLCKHSINND